MLLGAAAATLATTDAGDDAAGLLVLAADDTVEMANRAADRWLDEIRAGDHPGPPLPPVVRAVAHRARHAAAVDADDSGDPPGTIARARVRTATGRWLTVRGSLLGDDPGSRVAVLMEPAPPSSPR
jgi:hypothetical protein